MLSRRSRRVLTRNKLNPQTAKIHIYEVPVLAMRVRHFDISMNAQNASPWQNMNVSVPLPTVITIFMVVVVVFTLTDRASTIPSNM